MRRRQHLFVGGKSEVEPNQTFDLMLSMIERIEERGDIGLFEVVLRLLDFVLVVNVAIGDATKRPIRPHQVENAFDILQIHRKPLEAIGDLASNRTTLEPADLLEVGELSHLHTIQPNLPTEAPGTERRRLPVVFDEANIMNGRIEADRTQGVQIHFLNIVRRWLDNNLILIIVLQAKRVIAISTISRSPARLYIGRAPGLRPHRAQESARVKGACAHRHIVRLHDDAAARGPEFLQMQNQVLKALWGGCGVDAHCAVTGGSKARSITAKQKGGHQNGVPPSNWEGLALKWCVGGRDCTVMVHGAAPPRRKFF